MDWYIKVIKSYGNFSGRARRKEYWTYTLISAVFSLVLGIADFFLGAEILTSLYSLFVLVPELAVSFRRLHDIGKSAWWLWIAFVPLVGAIVLLVFTVREGTAGPNRYGEDPKTVQTL